MHSNGRCRSTYVYIHHNTGIYELVQHVLLFRFLYDKKKTDLDVYTYVFIYTFTPQVLSGEGQVLSGEGSGVQRPCMQEIEPLPCPPTRPPPATTIFLLFFFFLYSIFSSFLLSPFYTTIDLLPCFLVLISTTLKLESHTPCRRRCQ